MCSIGYKKEESKKEEQLKLVELKGEAEKVIKMKWVYVKKIDQTFWIVLDENGRIRCLHLKGDTLILIHERTDFMNNEILKSSISSVNLEYMGNWNFKVIIWSQEMTIIDYNFNVTIASDVLIQDITTVHNLSNLFSLPCQFVYKSQFIPHLGLSYILCRKELYLFDHTSTTLK
jgi:hypothetical protein